MRQCKVWGADNYAEAMVYAAAHGRHDATTQRKDCSAAGGRHDAIQQCKEWGVTFTQAKAIIDNPPTATGIMLQLNFTDPRGHRAVEGMVAGRLSRGLLF